MKKTIPQPIQEEWRIRSFVAVLKRRWMIVAFALVIGMAFAVLFQTFYPRKYESKTQLLVMRKDPRLATKGVESGTEAEVRVTEDLLATHMQMIQSRSLVEAALKDDGLSELPSIVANLLPNEKPCDAVINRLTLTRGGSGQARTAHVLNISYRSRSEADAQLVLRAIVKKYQSFLASKFQDVNQEAAALLVQAQENLASDLQAAEQEYERFRQSSSNLMWRAGASETTNVHRVRYEGILHEISNLQLARADVAARLDAVNERLSERLGTAVSDEFADVEKLSLIDEKNLTRVGLLLVAQKGEAESPLFQAEQPIRLAHARVEYDSYANLQSKETSLLTELGDRHPEVQNLRKQIASLSSIMGKQKQELKSGTGSVSPNPKMLFDAYYQLLRNDILSMDRREERLSAAAEVAKQQASEMVADELQGESLKREVQRKQVLFDAAVDRLRDINLAKDYGGFINEVLAEPELGLQVMPKLPISAALGLLLSIGVSALGIGIAEYRDRRFHSIDSIQEMLQVPVLGRIPSIDAQSSGKRLSKSDLLSGALGGEQDSRQADAFRKMRSSPVFAMGDYHRQVLCITSPMPGDGKSTVTANLAKSLGQLGRRVLVVDCDLRRPTLHELFKVSNERGLTTVIEGGGDPSDLIQPTSQKNVWVLTRGPAVSNPAEILATGEFSRLLESLREKFDHIFLDTPPVLPLPDVLVSASIADGVIVVISVQRTTQLQAQATCSSLQQAGAELEGIVVNRLTAGIMSEDDYEYQYGYGYADSGYAKYTSSGSTAENGEAIGASSFEYGSRRNGRARVAGREERL